MPRISACLGPATARTASWCTPVLPVRPGVGRRTDGVCWPAGSPGLGGGSSSLVVPARWSCALGLSRSQALLGVRGQRTSQVEAGTLDLPALTTVIGGSALLVSGDTGVAHLATALSTPSVLLFGPTAPQYWGPAIDSTRHTVLWHGSVDEPGNPHGDVIDPALASITASEVIEAVSDLLAVVMPEVPDSW